MCVRAVLTCCAPPLWPGRAQQTAIQWLDFIWLGAHNSSHAQARYWVNEDGSPPLSGLSAQAVILKRHHVSGSPYFSDSLPNTAADFDAAVAKKIINKSHVIFTQSGRLFKHGPQRKSSGVSARMAAVCALKSELFSGLTAPTQQSPT